MKNFMYIPKESQGKIIVHKGNEETPLQKEYKKLQNRMNLMTAQWMEDYSNIQSENNVRRGIAGEVEFFDEMENEINKTFDIIENLNQFKA